jgi:hypothetical protein
VLSLKRLRWLGHSARILELRYTYSTFTDYLKGIEYFGDVDVSGKITEKCV